MSPDRIFLTVLLFVSLALGAAIGILLSDTTYRRALMSLCYFAVRMVHKTCLRTGNPESVCLLEEVDRQHSTMSTGDKRNLADPSALQAVEIFKDNLKKIYGEELSAIYFFGSRMRGNHADGSDLDVVLFFRPSISLSHARRQTRREVFHLLVQHGLLIQPRITHDQALYFLNAESHPAIRRAVQTGILIE